MVEMHNKPVTSPDEVIELEPEDLGFDEILSDNTPADTGAFPPRSFAQLQLRARSALKALFGAKERHLLLLCGPNSLDLMRNAAELCRDLGQLEPILPMPPPALRCLAMKRSPGF